MFVEDQQALWLTFKLAAVTTIILMLLGAPFAWWLSRYHGRFKAFINALVALPLVLPPTVLGFYLLLALAPNGFIGQGWALFSDTNLAFSFYGILIGSLIYSLPFVVQPLYNGFSQLDKSVVEVGMVLGAGPWDRFFNIILPTCKHSFISAATLGFAHTVGEFGVVLMIGGNIPGQTQVLSIALFDHVEAGNYTQAHWLALGLVVFSVVVLTLVNMLGNTRSRTQSKQQGKGVTDVIG